MKDKNKKPNSEDDLNAFLESFKQENPDYTEEELEGVKKLFLTLNAKLMNKNPGKALVLKLLNSLLVYFIVTITIIGFMSKTILLEPFWWIFPIALGFSLYMLVFRLGLNFLSQHVHNYFFLIAIGLAFNICLASLLNSLAYPLFSSTGAIFGFFLGWEVFYQIYRFVMMRKALRGLIS